MPCGILNVYKPSGPTSFDVVAAVRRLAGIKRVGHLGTLDPMAEGVLPVAIGSAARVMEYLDGETKDYLAKVKLGISTDTQDITGEVISRGDCSGISSEDIEGALRGFIGSCDQVPPAYSALKLNGKKLYEYARKGITPDIEPRRIFIEDIRDISFDGEMGEVSFLAVVSKGTYIRTLADDLGKKLGCGACLSGLVRSRSGCFDLEHASALDDLTALTPDELFGLLKSPDSALMSFGRIDLGEWESRLFSSGVPLREDQWDPEQGKGFPAWLSEETAERYKKTFRVYGSGGAFIGVGHAEPDGTLKTDKVFV